MQRNRNDVVAEIKTARDEAQIKANAYKNLTAKQYDYWRAIAAVRAYGQALDMFIAGTEHQIPDMATTAHASFEHAHNDDPTATEMTLATTNGRRDALASVADWMNTKESNR